MWKSELLECRRDYYLMNYLNGSQIHRLYDFLERSTSGDDVSTFLKFIHPKLSSGLIKTIYDQTGIGAHGFLSHIGRCLHTVYKDLPSSLYRRALTDIEETSNTLSDVVHEGRLMLLNLEENSDFVARTLMALYYNTFKSLPEPSQVMFCSGETSCDDIDLFLGRCLCSKKFFGHAPLFCVAYVEKLPNELQFHLVDRLRDLENVDDFRLSVICRGSKNHPFVDQLAEYMSAVQPVSDNLFSTILQQIYPQITTFTSEVAGLGKSTVISKTARKERKSIITVHVSGQINRDDFVVNLKSLNIKEHHVMHLDIGSVDDPRELDTLVFELLVLSYVSAGTTAYCLPTTSVYIEIANTINNTLRNSLPTTTAFKRIHLNWTHFDDFTASRELFSATQIVCHYLKALDQNYLDTLEIHFQGADAVKPLAGNECRKLLRGHLNMSSDISYSIVHTFLNVLADQLKKFSASVYFRISSISDMLGCQHVGSVRSCLIKAMVEVAREFASRSVNACRSTQSNATDDRSKTNTDLATKLVNRTDSMIRWEESNHLIYVFHNQNIQTLSPMYREKLKVPGHILKLFQTQMNKELENYDQKNQSQLQDILQRVARKDPSPISKCILNKMCDQYALTPDNLLKMVLIMLRIQANVPVVVMGETGCGKTSLIRYLAGICEISFSVVNIHAGTTKQNVIKSVLLEHELCLQTPCVQRWLFLDEINTSECIGVICDIICHHTCNGKRLAPNLAILGACNPYKLRTVDSINTAGLSSKVKTDDLSKLVYRVLPLPEMMVDFVWDFGSLSDTDEQRYIIRMTESMLKSGFKMQTLLSDMLCISQAFVRNEEKSSFVVSLRDVNRCIRLVSWFVNVLSKNSSLFSNTLTVNNEVKAIILALTHCYHSRFTDKSSRLLYRERLAIPLIKQKVGIKTAADIHDIIKDAQSDFLNRMDLPPGTAKNTALKENVFMILVCILNRIPIFVVGKPGCSKSLAIQVIRSNLRGKDSKDDFFKTLPQLHCVSFQGSESSTSDGILKVFEKAERYQESNTNEDVLSVVILDEIGLAEISRFNPLKVLHNLLEPDGKSVPNVAVVGISNWALDASKMNRAIHLSRPDMDEEELFETGKSICLSFIEQIQTAKPGLFANELNSKMALSDILSDLENIALAYVSYTKKLHFKNFHGLRDFYALVKYIAKRLSKETMVTVETKSHAIMEGLQRNFGGLKSERQRLLAEFQACVSSTAPNWHVPALIKENIQDTIARHLMVITSGESVLGLIDQILREADRSKPERIFGSQFEEDLTDDYHYRILSRIILCMEQGVVLILRDLEHIYGSLYDMLNQNYTRIGKKNNCRVALGPHSNPFCHVADSFRCIVLVEATRLDLTDPPFLNRFEKQFLSFADILSEHQTGLVQRLKLWVDHISIIKGRTFSRDDIFPIYSDELLVSIVLSVSQLEKNDDNDDSIFIKCKHLLMWIIKPEAVLRIQHAEDSLIRMASSGIIQEYFELPLHEGLENLIKFHRAQSDRSMFQDTMCTEDNISTPTRLCIVFTNSNIHTRIPENLLDVKIQTEKLGAFKSEKQLYSRLQEFWSSEKNVLLIHCHAVDDQRHLTLTMTSVNKFREEKNELSQLTTFKFVYMILHMSTKVLQGTASPSEVQTHPLGEINFLSGWDLVTLESLIKPVFPLPQLCSHTLKGAVQSMRPLNKVIQENLFWCFSRIRYGRRSRNIESVSKVIRTIESSEQFLSVLEEKIMDYIEETTDGNCNEGWFRIIANDINALNTSATLLDALMKHIELTIKMPLAKLIFKLEDIGALDSFFVNDARSELRREYWLSMFNNEKFSVVKSQDESGPESFQCTIPDLSLAMPFSRQIFMDIESTKDIFLNEVRSAKAKCNIETDDELPPEVMSELINQHKDIISSKIRLCEWMGYIRNFFLDDYVEDYCNQLSYQCCYGLNRSLRIECTSWAINQKLKISKLSQQSPLEAIALLHCIGWVHMPQIGSFLHMCSVFVNAFPSADSPIKLFTFAHSEPIEQPTQLLDQLAEQHIDHEHDEIDSLTMKSTIDHETELQAYTDTISTEALQKCVSFLCSYAIPTKENHPDLSNYTQWENIFKNLVLASRSISDSSKEYQSLRLCSDIYDLAVVKSNVTMGLLFGLGAALKEHELDSTFVSSTIASIIESVRSVDDNQALYRITRQYLNSCLLLNERTNFSFLLELLDSGTIPLSDIQLIKVSLEIRIDLATEEDRDVLTQIIMNDAFSETHDDCFFTHLDKCVQSIFQRTGTIGSFEVLITDLIEAQFVNNSEQFDSDLILACGRIFQTREERPVGIQFLTAIAYIRAVIRHLSVDVLSVDPLFETFVTVLSGLENNKIGHKIFILFLKYFAADKSISDVMHLYTKLSDQTTRGQICQWTSGYFHTCSEFNTLVYHNRTDVLNEANVYFQSDDKRPKQFTSYLVKSLEKTHTALQPLLAFTLAVKEFYLPAYIKVTDDTSKSLAQPFEEVFTKCLSQEQNSFLKCVLGLHDFADERLMHGPETNYQQFVLNSVLVSSFALALSCQYSKDETHTLPPITQCLVCPLEESTRYFTDMTDSSPTHSFHCVDEKSDPMYHCTCGNTIVFHVRHPYSKCMLCGSDVDLQTIVKGTNTGNSSPNSMANKTLSSTAKEVLGFLAKGEIVGSIALRFTTSEEVVPLLAGVNSYPSLNSCNVLWENLHQHWANVKEMLNLEDFETGIFFHLVMRNGNELLFRRRLSLQNQSERLRWESEFEKIVEAVENNILNEIAAFVRESDTKFGLDPTSIELQIREADQACNDELHTLFRVTRCAGKVDFVRQLWRQRLRFPFLQYVVENENVLKLPDHIHSIIQWHMSVVANINYTLKRNECFEMTVNEYQNRLRDTNAKSASKKRFKNFKESWNVLALEYPDLKINKIDISSKMAECLIFDSDGSISKVLKWLVNTQNKLISHALHLSKDCTSLQFLLRSPDVSCCRSVPISEVRKEDLVALNDEWFIGFIIEESHCGLQYGHGRQIEYDFINIEKRLAEKLLFAKAFVVFNDLPRIVFIDELYRNFLTLVKEVCDSIEQSPLPIDLEESIKRKSEDNKSLSVELLNSLDMIMTILKHTQCNPYKPLIDFVNERKSVARGFPTHHLPSPESRLVVGHVISFHEFLEELSAERIIEGLSDEYHSELDGEAVNHLTSIQNIRIAELILKAIKRLTYRCIFMSNVPKDQTLIQFLSEPSFWPSGVFQNNRIVIDGQDEDIAELFPQAVTICHVGTVCQILADILEVNFSNFFVSLKY
ncbi:hypothetical protein DPMN_186267 [Dreissena polymorpha]|uniref:AAA+ ATPase domain-containing protein n=1 Tax=Dreissena polymorpha TaxID=45954 RepID=A0A9D4DML5_DREPO|nr:hypothetical protein DPMN_186267 [Dreissena polymorpha]